MVRWPRHHILAPRLWLPSYQKHNPFKTNSSPTEPSVLQSKTKAAHNLERKEEGTSSYLLSRKPGSWDLCPLDPPSDLHSFHCCSVSWGHRGKEPRVKPGTGPGEHELCVMCACSLSVQSPRQSQGEGDADHHEDSPKWVPLGERLSRGCLTSMGILRRLQNKYNIIKNFFKHVS